MKERTMLRPYAGLTQPKIFSTGTERTYILRYLTGEEYTALIGSIEQSRWDRLRYILAPMTARWAAACDLWLELFYAPNGPPSDVERRLEAHGYRWQANKWRWFKECMDIEAMKE